MTNPTQPSLIKELNSITARLRDLERRPFSRQAAPDVTEVDSENLPSYSWQSPETLATMTGHRLYADRDGVIQFIRAERSAADGTGTATLDVLKNGTSIFPTNTKPTVAAGQGLGPEAFPDTRAFSKGDYFEAEIEATGGGSGPLRVTIKFVSEA